MAVEQLHCERCDYDWTPKKDPSAVERCPKCKSTRWDRDPDTVWQCPVCGRTDEKKVACSSHIRRKGGEGHGPPGLAKAEPVEITPPDDWGVENSGE